MAYAKKTWLQRIVSLPGRRRLTSTGTEDVYDMSRAEGEIIQEGDAWSAANMNDMEGRIEAGLDEKLDVTKVVEDLNVTEEGYALGAKTAGEAIAALNDSLNSVLTYIDVTITMNSVASGGYASSQITNVSNHAKLIGHTVMNMSYSPHFIVSVNQSSDLLTTFNVVARNNYTTALSTTFNVRLWFLNT